MNKNSRDKPLAALNLTCQRVGIAADHGGFELKGYPVKMMHEAGQEMIDCGN